MIDPMTGILLIVSLGALWFVAELASRIYDASQPDPEDEPTECGPFPEPTNIERLAREGQ